MSRKYLFILNMLNGKDDNIVQLYQYLLENEKQNNFQKEETIMALCLNIIYAQQPQGMTIMYYIWQKLPYTILMAFGKLFYAVILLMLIVCGRIVIRLENEICSKI